MGNILVYLDQNEGVLPKSAKIAITAAGELKGAWSKDKLIGVCLGKGASAAADEALTFGLDEVHFSEDAAYEKYRAVAYACACQSVYASASCDAAVATANTTGKDFFPRLAAKVDAVQASDIIGINSDGSLVRPMYAGDVIAEIELSGDHKFVTLRATAFDAAQPSSASGAKKELGSVDIPAIAGEVVGYELSGGDRPELTDAEVVVSGGRAMQSEENFEKVLFPLADALGAAVGASRAAVDSGYAPNDWQVGQTGKVVAPNLYIAVGISGAIQHLAGMKDSKVIVAINKDPDAPIYEIADYGLVADLYEVVPELTEAIKAAKSAG